MFQVGQKSGIQLSIGAEWENYFLPSHEEVMGKIFHIACNACISEVLSSKKFEWYLLVNLVFLTKCKIIF